MAMGTAFWVLMLIWVVFSAWNSWPDYRAGGGSLLLFILLLLLGWSSFGAPIR